MIISHLLRMRSIVTLFLSDRFGVFLHLLWIFDANNRYDFRLPAMSLQFSTIEHCVDRVRETNISNSWNCWQFRRCNLFSDCFSYVIWLIARVPNGNRRGFAFHLELLFARFSVLIKLNHSPRRSFRENHCAHAFAYQLWGDTYADFVPHFAVAPLRWGQWWRNGVWINHRFSFCAHTKLICIQWFNGVARLLFFVTAFIGSAPLPLCDFSFSFLLQHSAADCLGTWSANNHSPNANECRCCVGHKWIGFGWQFALIVLFKWSAFRWQKAAIP